jgi:2-dehydro-3-deoxy-D-arabinonate dehydratase
MSEHMFLINHGGRLCLQVGETAYELGNAIPWLDWLLGELPADEVGQRLSEARGAPIALDPAAIGPPIGAQEVWASGVTYKRSEEARERESHNSTIYTRVYSAARPELFMKALGEEVIGSGAPAGIRYDATWSVPEPELAIVLNRRMEVVGFTIGNDMSSRDIEGENPLYLPQAKVYERSCVLGPRIWLQPGRTEWPDVQITIAISRAGAIVFDGATSTAQINRSLADLRDYLGRCKRFPRGVVLLSGTGIVPPDDFTLQPGDEVRITIDPIGELVNPIVVVGGAEQS